MPELPDLQVFSHNLDKQLSGKKVKRVHLVNSKRAKTTARSLQQGLEGQVLDSVKRSGKELHFIFKNDHVLGIHLMLRGQLHVYEGTQEHKYIIMKLLFADDTTLELTDYRAMAVVTLDPAASDVPDAMQVKKEYLEEKLSKKRGTIKSFLLDQQQLRGIGNAYADEILWDARISPFSVCNKIPAKAVTALAHSISKVLKDAEQHIRTKHPGIISGEVRDFLKIHNPDEGKSPAGAIIHQKTTGGRKTYYTDEQQEY